MSIELCVMDSVMSCVQLKECCCQDDFMSIQLN